MLIVADTTPIISLIKIGELELLNSMYGEIILPEAVYKELISNPSMRNEIEIVEKSSFLKVTKVENEFAVKLLQKQLNLGAGESEAIATKVEIKVEGTNVSVEKSAF